MCPNFLLAHRLEWHQQQKKFNIVCVCAISNMQPEHWCILCNLSIMQIRLVALCCAFACAFQAAAEWRMIRCMQLRSASCIMLSIRTPKKLSISTGPVSIPAQGHTCVHRWQLTMVCLADLVSSWPSALDLVSSLASSILQIQPKLLPCLRLCLTCGDSKCIIPA